MFTEVLAERSANCSLEGTKSEAKWRELELNTLLELELSLEDCVVLYDQQSPIYTRCNRKINECFIS